jgi:predicted transcriptional regulator
MRNQREHGNSDILEMTTEIVSSYVNGNEIRAENISDII